MHAHSRKSVVAQVLKLGVPFAVATALFWWIFGVTQDEPNSIVSIITFGLLGGLLFGLFLTVYERWRWGTVESTTHPSFAGDGAILLETPAIHDQTNGWLATNGTELLFRVDSPNYRDLRINLGRIKQVREWKPTGSSGEGFEVDLIDGAVERFEIEDAQPWYATLEKIGVRAVVLE